MANRKFPEYNADKPFCVENNTTAGYWCHRPENTLPSPDMIGAYMLNRPLPPESVEECEGWIIGSGIATQSNPLSGPPQFFNIGLTWSGH